MADEIDLTGDILRGHPLVVGYVDSAGNPSLSFRGSALVYAVDQIAIWARDRDRGLAAEIVNRPEVALVYFGNLEGPGAHFLSIRGRAHVEPSANTAVYDSMVASERGRDPEKAGVAVIIDVDSVSGIGPEGRFEQVRA
jgi:hypothetical protein